MVDHDRPDIRVGRIVPFSDQKTATVDNVLPRPDHRTMAQQSGLGEALAAAGALNDGEPYEFQVRPDYPAKDPHPICSVCRAPWNPGPAYETHECEPEVGNPLFLLILDYMRDLHRRKAAGYAGTGQPDAWRNFREAANWGIAPSIGVEVRLGDKYRRLQNIIRRPDNEQLGETRFDTSVDLSSYSIIDICVAWEEGKVILPDHPLFAGCCPEPVEIVGDESATIEALAEEVE